MAKLTYPLTANQGTLELSPEYPDRVREAIISALLTVRGERVYRPETYGLDLEVMSAIRIPDVLREARVVIDAGLEGYEGVSYQLTGGLSLDEGTVTLGVTYQCGDLPPETLEIPLIVLPG